MQMYLGNSGLVCSVGLNVRAACAAIRAGIAKFDELPYLDMNGERIVGAAVPGLDWRLKRDQRLVELLALALSDCLGKDFNVPFGKVPLLVGLGEPERPAGGAVMAATIVAKVQEKLGISFHPTASLAYAKGHTAGFEGLRLARDLLSQDPDIPGCIVCGADSYINASSLLWLEQQWRLKKEDHSDGVIPGEAGAAVYVQRQPAAYQEVKVKVIGLGFGKEKATVSSEEPLLGKGLAAATRTALAEANLQIHELDFRLSDATGEAYGFKEQAMVIARLQSVWKEKYPHWHCADSVGDIGAAAGILQLVVAAHAFEYGYAVGDRTICFTSATTGDRAVTILQGQDR